MEKEKKDRLERKWKLDEAHSGQLLSVLGDKNFLKEGGIVTTPRI